MTNPRTTSSITLLSALAGTLLAAACGGGGTGSAAGAGNSGGTGPAPTPAPLALGSTAFPGLDWGDTMAAVQADYPAATTSGDELVLKAAHGGRDAEISFMFTGDQLISIDVAYPGELDSMDACGAAFQAVRAELDKALGGSGEDNLASYWSTDSASVTLACNPAEDGVHGELGVSYSLPEPEDM